MNTAAEVLLIVVSSVLAVFLLVLIAVLVKVFMILRQVKRLVTKAERVAEKAEAVGDFFKKSTGPTNALRRIARMINKLTDHKDEE